MKIFDAGQQIDVPDKTLLDWYSATVLYVGVALPTADASDAAWLIKRVTFDGSGNPVSIEYASNGSVSCVWANRLALIYG